MTIQLAYQQLVAQLYDVYDNREATNIADLVIEHVTGQRKIDRIMYKDLPVHEDQQLQLTTITQQLLQHKPIQYVLGKAWFMNMELLVNENVLIPRPETEELVNCIITDLKSFKKPLIDIIDIGTGSGCIAIALKKQVPEAQVTAIDISESALRVASKNAISQSINIHFKQLDFLHESAWSQLGKYDVIVSNPPYIKQSEEALMHKNVLDYEPHQALFVPNENALIFYEALLKFNTEHLHAGGFIYAEINEALGEQTKDLFTAAALTEVIVKKDLQGKDRMIRGTKNGFKKN